MPRPGAGGGDKGPEQDALSRAGHRSGQGSGLGSTTASPTSQLTADAQGTGALPAACPPQSAYTHLGLLHAIATGLLFRELPLSGLVLSQGGFHQA